MNSRLQFLFAVVLVILAALSRLIPHPMNFAPITALALFGGVYFDKKVALILPLAAMLLSNYFLGFYAGMEWVYASFLLSVVWGMWLKSRKTVPMIAATTLVNSVMFFIISNFGVWYAEILYPKTVAGLLECYAMALPFFRNTIAGDLFYVAVMFGVYELAIKYFPKTETTKV